MFDPAEPTEPQVASLRQTINRLREWLSPTTSFDFEVAHPVEECAERLRRSQRTGLRSWLSGSGMEVKVEGDGYGSYHFSLTQTREKARLNATGFLTDNGESATLVEGKIRHSTGPGVALIFFVMSVVIIAAFGFAAFKSVNLVSVMICVPFAMLVSAAGLVLSRSSMLASQRDGIGTIMAALVMDEQPVKKKKRML
jgi:hypothetical protein